MHYAFRSRSLTLLVGLLVAAGARNSSAQTDVPVDFSRDIKPILEKRCMRCHAPPDPKEDLDFSLPSAVLDSYVIAEDPAGSDFYQRMITDDVDLMMPPPDDGGPIPREEALLVRLWIMEGAEWPDDVELLSPQAGGGATDPPTGDQTTGDLTPVLATRIDFVKDVKPILEAKCIECHGGDNPADGIDFSSRENVLGNYVLAGEPQSSSMYKRLVTEDLGKLMPPPDAGGPVASAESLVIRLWIEEGAQWPEGVTLGAVAEEVPPPKSFLGKVWTFQGYFHPATVHFPVALISISALFVILNWIFGGSFRDAAFYCLLFGTAGGVVASLMGWALSPSVGFGSRPFAPSEAVFWHRWCGVGVAVFGLLISILAIRARSIERKRRLERAGKNMVWQVGVLLLAILVGITGHQGGELTYGESWYQKAFAQFDTPEEPVERRVEEPAGEPTSNSPDDTSEDDDSDDDEPTL